MIADVIETTLRPRGPYSLALTATLAYDATRSFLDGVLTCAFEDEVAQAYQRRDGTIAVCAESEAGVERLRFVLALDDDPTEFHRRFADDALVGRTIRELRGLRPLRVPTVAGALLRALCGQLIQSSHARDLERTVVRATSPRRGRFSTPPTRATLGARSPADLRRLGLHGRRGATLVRLCAALDPERLRGLPVGAVAGRLLRERGLGPWSVGVIALQGLGSYEFGLVGDLGLIKLCRALRGRPVDVAETAELLEPYAEWQGIASVYLLRGLARGLVPVPPNRGRRAAA
jgi:3-methyladenine DNA glycosylase/8-oxoguanine DNA glycosylase